MKKCLRCHIEKDEREFNNEKGKEVNYCSKCREYQKRYYEENRDKIKKAIKQYRKANKDKIREYKKKRREENIDKIREYGEKWRAKNRDKKKEYDKKRYIKNRNKIREYYEENRGRKPKFSSYAHKLTIEEDPICGEEGEILVRCAKCKKYFAPINISVQSRVQALNGSRHGESRLYCSQACKDSCEVYNTKYDPYTRHASVERDPAWAKAIKKRASFTCERCGSKENLEAHHEIPMKMNSELVNDEMNGICLCHECHMKAHSESGCTLADLRKI